MTLNPKPTAYAVNEYRLCFHKVMWTRRFLLNSSSWFYDDIIFQDAKLNEVDSGTELDSQAEDEVEEIGSVENVEKDETEKKEDWFWFLS